jgi:hypothetical protein
LPLRFTEEADGLVLCIAVTKGGVRIGEIRKPKLAETYRYYPDTSSFLSPPAIEDADLESLKQQIAEHFSTR